jgi:yecA family protein
MRRPTFLPGMTHSSAGRLRTFLKVSNRPARHVDGTSWKDSSSLASAPELVTPSEWLSIVFGEQAPGFASVDNARAILGDLMIVGNSVNEAVYEGCAALPAACRLRRPAGANLEDAAPVAQWSRGFLRGHGWPEESWDPYIRDERDEDYAAMLMTLRFFASRNLAEVFCAEVAPIRQKCRRPSFP